MKLPRVSSAFLIKRLMKRGFEKARHQGKGSHTVLFKTDATGQKLLVVVPKRDILPAGVLLSIMKQGRFTRDEFLELLTA
ncbi:type II toxin-antitoxin system HicA family toxin [Methanoregula sp.]|uniref:type II toxin-antitoxin system HicA family toxin n=1 Tax=Methanoregula sp. TaxID=2052170 RepID=UPI0026256406|nr:type II toxin-antitoxin system HicA family toxin [Methanoregula sp.]MDD5144500.1 type II toxin-antitoxin system HicA family toxin [Methanoregula sp.]